MAVEPTSSGSSRSESKRATRDTRTEAARRTRVIVAVVLLAIVLAVALDNTKSTRLGYVFGGFHAPLVVALLVAGVIGAAIEWLLLHRPRRRG
jgi:uncharacterized integral membrane protein